jgi:hypothetical protein
MSSSEITRMRRANALARGPRPSPLSGSWTGDSLLERKVLGGPQITFDGTVVKLCCDAADPIQTIGSLCAPNSLNIIAAHLRNYMTEFRNSNFWAYTCDGDISGYYIRDGGNDMYDRGNYTTPWLLSGALYNTGDDDLVEFPEAVPYITTSQTVTDSTFNYVSLGYINDEDTEDEPQPDQSRHPLTILGYRCDGPVGWQIGGELGADGGGDVSSNILYAGATINGFTVHAAYRQVYNAGDPTVCNLILLLGHPSWSSVFGPILTDLSNTDTDSNGFYFAAGSGSQNILAIHTLLSKPDTDDILIPDSELQAVVAAFTARIGEILAA